VSANESTIDATREELAEAGRYSLVLRWSDEDQAYIVTVPELPGCITHGATQVEAVRQAQDAIATWLEGARAAGEPLPSPRLFNPAEAFAHVRE
jgi:predicted RNase H-like HicB family nuclease